MTDFLFTKTGKIILAVVFTVAVVLLMFTTYESDGVLRYENGEVICHGTKHWKKWNPSFFKFECDDRKMIIFE